MQILDFEIESDQEFSPVLKIHGPNSIQRDPSVFYAKAFSKPLICIWLQFVVLQNMAIYVSSISDLTSSKTP